MDQALWISWYDLPDTGRDAYLKWAHGTYIPQMIKRPGILWGAHFKCEAVVPMSGVPHGRAGPAAPHRRPRGAARQRHTS